MSMAQYNVHTQLLADSESEDNQEGDDDREGEGDWGCGVCVPVQRWLTLLGFPLGWRSTKGDGEGEVVGFARRLLKLLDLHLEEPPSEESEEIRLVGLIGEAEGIARKIKTICNKSSKSKDGEGKLVTLVERLLELLGYQQRKRPVKESFSLEDFPGMNQRNIYQLQPQVCSAAQRRESVISQRLSQLCLLLL
jgi:hypothetical protein